MGIGEFLLKAIAVVVITLIFWRLGRHKLPFTLEKKPKPAMRIPRIKNPIPSQRAGSSAHSSLVRACMGDKAKAARLVAYERKRNSRLSESQAVLAALERLQHDRSR